MYNIFLTEEKANLCQDYDFVKHMEIFSDNNGYDNTTTRWWKPQQRLDGKWVTLVCLNSDSKYIRILPTGNNDVISETSYNSLSLVEKALYEEIIKEEINTGGVWFEVEE